jgi:CRP-like cAMP-binding protein
MIGMIRSSLSASSLFLQSSPSLPTGSGAGQATGAAGPAATAAGPMAMTVRERTRAVLAKEPENRTPGDVDLLVEVTSPIEFFQKHPRELVKELLAVTRYGRASPGEAIFRAGSVGERFYVVLSGTLAVYLPVAAEDPARAEPREDASLMERTLMSRKGLAAKLQLTLAPDDRKERARMARELARVFPGHGPDGASQLAVLDQKKPRRRKPRRAPQPLGGEGAPEAGDDGDRFKGQRRADRARRRRRQERRRKRRQLEARVLERLERKRAREESGAMDFGESSSGEEAAVEPADVQELESSESPSDTAAVAHRRAVRRERWAARLTLARGLGPGGGTAAARGRRKRAEEDLQVLSETPPPSRSVSSDSPASSASDYSYYSSEDDCVVDEATGQQLSPETAAQKVQIRLARDHNYMATLGPGDSFGELALLNNEPRAATVLALETVELIIVERADFLRLLKSHEERRQFERVSFLACLPSLNHLANAYLLEVSHNFKEQTVPRHAVICHQRSMVKNVFILRTGACRVLKTLERHRDIKYPIHHEVLESNLVEVCKIGCGEWIGDHSALFSSPQAFTVIADTETTFLVIAKPTLFSGLNQQTFDILKVAAEARLARWEERAARLGDLIDRKVVNLNSGADASRLHSLNMQNGAAARTSLKDAEGGLAMAMTLLPQIQQQQQQQGGQGGQGGHASSGPVTLGLPQKLSQALVASFKFRPGVEKMVRQPNQPQPDGHHHHHHHQVTFLDDPSVDQQIEADSANAAISSSFSPSSSSSSPTQQQQYRPRPVTSPIKTYPVAPVQHHGSNHLQHSVSSPVVTLVKPTPRGTVDVRDPPSRSKSALAQVQAARRAEGMDSGLDRLQMLRKKKSKRKRRKNVQAVWDDSRVSPEVEPDGTVVTASTRQLRAFLAAAEVEAETATVRPRSEVRIGTADSTKFNAHPHPKLAGLPDFLETSERSRWRPKQAFAKTSVILASPRPPAPPQQQQQNGSELLETLHRSSRRIEALSKERPGMQHIEAPPARVAPRRPAVSGVRMANTKLIMKAGNTWTDFDRDDLVEADAFAPKFEAGKSEGARAAMQGLKHSRGNTQSAWNSFLRDLGTTRKTGGDPIIRNSRATQPSITHGSSSLYA